MTKTLNQIIFFPPPKSEYFFSNIGNQNIFLEKNHNIIYFFSVIFYFHFIPKFYLNDNIEQ